MACPSPDSPPTYEPSNEDSPPAYDGEAIGTIFPAQLAIYRKTGLLRPVTAVLAAHESTPLHHISLGVGLLDAGLPDVALHANANEGSSIIARSKLDSSDDSHSVQLTDFGSPISEDIKLRSRSSSRKYVFTIDCEGPGMKANSTQGFEWRPSRGQDVRGLGLRDYGWKLVWLEDPTNNLVDHGTSLGVVAVWSRCSSANSKKMMGFRFLGKGSTGDFGKHWEVMAVVTALAIWHTEITD
ncbi:hypothetical protein JX265_002014 [Neoarthrinium moseri]|uniref:Uncharacterized protein n=1 Tax=Neoarthrinium moseri TaxID=1658444 RepID=A0A9P9WWL6_9PEZI|nr:hypothetical protein JX265_002014 [Neoarthrinium moseri]